MSNEQIALLISQALEKLIEHDEKEGSSPLLDEARALLQEACDNIEL
jgi:hypothetical protein